MVVSFSTAIVAAFHRDRESCVTTLMVKQTELSLLIFDTCYLIHKLQFISYWFYRNQIGILRKISNTLTNARVTFFRKHETNVEKLEHYHIDFWTNQHRRTISWRFIPKLDDDTTTWNNIRNKSAFVIPVRSTFKKVADNRFAKISHRLGKWKIHSRRKTENIGKGWGKKKRNKNGRRLERNAK